MRFLCDEMLSGLGRWLRAAGYDTKIMEQGTIDRKIYEEALHEGRYLLTRDRHFLEIAPHDKIVIFLSGNSLEDCVKELNGKLKINWLLHPFSRCLVCNMPVIDASPEVVSKLVPSDITLDQSQFHYCKHCQKAYWEGSHTSQMLDQLNKWQSL